MTDKMEYVDDEDDVTYIASHSLDKRLEKVERWVKIFTYSIWFATIIGLLVLWWVAKNNFFSQLLSVLKVCRQCGLVY